MRMRTVASPVAASRRRKCRCIPRCRVARQGIRVRSSMGKNIEGSRQTRRNECFGRLLPTAYCLLPLFQRVMVNDLRDDGEGNFNQLAVWALDLDARECERLRLLEAADNAAHARARLGHDLDVVLAVERLERRESFGHFHLRSPSPTVFSLVFQ